MRACDACIRTLDSFVFEAAVYARELKRRPDGLPLHRTESARSQQRKGAFVTQTGTNKTVYTVHNAHPLSASMSVHSDMRIMHS